LPTSTEGTKQKSQSNPIPTRNPHCIAIVAGSTMLYLSVNWRPNRNRGG